jgi:hypothetical protein
LRVAVDSSPLEGAGRVEDTFNLLGHAARKVVTCAARLLRWRPTTVAERAGVEVLLMPSIKAALDVDWSDPAEKSRALKMLGRRFGKGSLRPPHLYRRRRDATRPQEQELPLQTATSVTSRSTLTPASSSPWL